METFRLWLEPDTEIPGFWQLRHEIVTVPLADVLHKGIHPWQGTEAHSNLSKGFLEVLNSDEFKLSELAMLDYCGDISSPPRSYYCTTTSPFEELLQKIQKNILFVDRLSYAELLSMAKERLRRDWCDPVATRILSSACAKFEAMRSFLKKKDRTIKLSGYSDLGLYDLGKILSIEDFETEDNLLIAHGMPLTNFRSIGFLERITDERGLLQLTESIRDFRLKVSMIDGRSCPAVIYNCRVDQNKVHFLPVLEKNPSQRASARDAALRWRIDEGRYCFTTDVPRLSRMIEEQGSEISFPALDYTDKRQPATSSAKIDDFKIPRYAVGRILSRKPSADEIREILRNHNVSMTGRKEELLDKLALLSVRLYERQLLELNGFFGDNRFIRIQNGTSRVHRPFPVLEGLDLGNMVLAMYLMKHMRGNVILEADHENDTFDLLSLARALLREEVALEGAFIKVE